ncbi:MAG: DNA polymerase III subunit delta [Bacilli bacterium]|nr:DNA polymerase III subunit delta [Bacilli bacterium]
MSNNLYIIYGLDSFLIDLEVKKIIGDIDPINIVKYNLDEHLIDDVIDDASTLSLFSPQKTIIIKNSNIFTSRKNEIEHDLKKIEKYLSNPNPDSTLIFIVESEKLDERKKICKIINKDGIVKRVEVPKNLTKFVADSFDNYKISLENINLLLDRVGSNLGILTQEINKLKIYKDEDLTITKEDILEVTSKNSQPDLFLFVDYIVNKDLEKAFDMYKELRIFNEEPIMIISMLANKFRMMYQSKLLIQKGYTISDIATNLGSHPYPVKLAIEKGREYSSDLLLTYIEKLADLDFNIKSGVIDKELGLELFILSI